MISTSTLPAWFVNAIQALQNGDVEGWMKIYASDAVHEFPFAPTGHVRKLEGRDAIAAYMGQLPKFVRFGTLSDVRWREAGNELIIEATGQHRRVLDDTPKELSYVWFITLHNGLVSHFRDYMNPLQLSAG